MNVAIYLYDGYYETEICIATMLFRKENLFVLSSGQDIITCMDGRKVLVDKKIQDLSSNDIDVLIIPGGNPILEPGILSLIKECHEKGSVVGGICGGVDYLAHAGILEGKKYTGYYKEGINYDFLPPNTPPTYSLYESDQNVISAHPHGYLEFAMELARLSTSIAQEDVAMLLRWFKTTSSYTL